MPYLADTNVAARWALTADPLYPVCRAAVFRLHHRGERIYVSPQNLVEFQALATRPVDANGLGMTPARASAEAARIEAVFPLLPDVPEIHARWRRLVDTFGVVGRQVFDARLVAVMLTHGMTHILTLNPTHFRRFAGEGITVIDPHDVPEDAANPE